MCLAIVFKPTGLIRPFSCLLGKIFKWCIHSSGDRKDDCLLGILAAGNPPQ